MPSTVRVATVDEIPVGSSKEVVAGDHVIAVFNVDGTYYAVDGVCPHAGGPLAQGRVLDGILACPWHGWQFELKTGKNCLNPRISAGCFSVRVEGADVVIELPDDTP